MHINALKKPRREQPQLTPSVLYNGFAANGNTTPKMLLAADVAPIALAAYIS